jgi:hypothetical protein
LILKIINDILKFGMLFGESSHKYLLFMKFNGIIERLLSQNSRELYV